MVGTPASCGGASCVSAARAYMIAWQLYTTWPPSSSVPCTNASANTDAKGEEEAEALADLIRVVVHTKLLVPHQEIGHSKELIL